MELYDLNYERGYFYKILKLYFQWVNGINLQFHPSKVNTFEFSVVKAFWYIYIKIRKCGMISNDTTIHKSSNKVNIANF